jgi:hypothetical protein
MGIAERLNEETKVKEVIETDTKRAKKDIQVAEELERLKLYPEYKTLDAMFQDFEKICRDELLTEYVLGDKGQKVEVPDAEVKLRQKIYNRVTWFIHMIDSKIEAGAMARKAIEQMETQPEEYYRKKHERN